MKKPISIALSLLMILNLTACVRLKTPAANATMKTTEAPTAEPTPEPTPTETPAPTDTPEPTKAPTPTPVPTEVPFDVIAANAMAKLEQARSIHMDIQLNMAFNVTVSMGETPQSMPMNIDVSCGMDSTRDPNVARLDLSLSAPGQEMRGLVYLVQDGTDTILYLSEDDGATWEKQTNPQSFPLPQSPAATFHLFTDAGINIQKTGTAQVNGRPATVYSGKVEGKYLQEVLSNAGAGEALANSFGAEMTEAILLNPGDMDVTFMIDAENGLPVRYVVDMTSALGNMLSAAFQQNMDGQSLVDAGITLEVPTAVLEIVLSQFDSIKLLQIPEAALNAPEA